MYLKPLVKFESLDHINSTQVESTTGKIAVKDQIEAVVAIKD